MAGDDKPSRPEATEVVGPARLLAGKYRVGRLIGEGGMGSVYAAEHTGLGAIVAVKLLNETCIADPDSLARFRREARAMGAVRHDHVVSVMDTGTDEDGAPFIVMEYLEGETLATILRRDRIMAPASATRIATQILSGLSAAHDKNIIHRDLKPGNVFMATQPDGSTRAKVLDFGVSKLADAAALSVTADGVAVGTPTYMAAEQLRGHTDLDARVDVYAVGVLLYRMVTGKLPFIGKNSEELNRKILFGRPTPPSQHRPEIKPELEAAVLKAMSVNREDRFANAEEFRRALTGISTAFIGQNILAKALMRAGRSVSADEVTTIEEASPPEEATVAASPQAKRDTIDPGDAATAAATSAGDVADATRTPAGSTRRRWLRWGALGAVIAGSAGAGVFAYRQLASTGPSGPPLRFGIMRFLPDDELQRRFAPLIKHLSKELDRPISLSIASDTDELIAMLAADEIELAALSPFAYVRARERLPDLNLLAAPVTPGGRHGYFGSILVRADSEIRSLADLRGKPFCYVKPGSTSGFLLPRAELRRAGLDPDVDFPSVHYGQNHLGTLKLLDKKACAGAAVFSKLWHDADKHRMDPSSFRPLVDFFMPHDAYVATRSMAPDQVAVVRAALLALRPGSRASEEMLGSLDQGGFAEVSDDAYQSIRDALEKEEAAGKRETQDRPDRPGD